ncbi:hypothetical protein SLS56_008073 [Neofusicoccum ribis]|uniref:SNF2 family helicase/ATPase n=1 Tax=Neofusicoccum ribis TaxID=45134 RepID=A0ABR3SM28_9PEZI
MPLAGDPLDWSVDEVVDALCRSTGWWKEGRSNSILPDPNTFETILRDEEINGYALLTYLTDQTLKEEFGIKTIGRRTAVLWAIDKLREQSPKYAEHLAAQRSIFTGQSPSTAGVPSIYGHVVTPWLGNLPPASLATPAYESTPLPTVLETEEETEIAVGSNKRPGETIVQDGDGRKRRKLLLAEPSTAPVPSHALDGQVKTASTRRQKKFPVDLIFYGDATFGQVLEDDDDLEFQHHGEVPAAMGPYVYRQFFHFIRSSERKELPQDGKKIVAIHPYRSTILPSNHPRSATVIEADSHSARATRQDALRLHGNIPFDSSIPYKDNGHHEWYSLAEKWSKDDDKVLPALGDSDEEEYSSSFEAELEAEERERALEEFRREQPRLSKEEVSAIIQERIEELVDIWKRKKLPRLQPKARVVWRKGQRSRGRLLLRGMAEERVKKISHRLEKLKDAIVGEVWHKKVEVLKQCATLEESVSQREEELWRMSIWDLKVEPARASASTTPRRPSNKRAKTDGKDLGEEAGDWVNSDSETESDGLEDFVEIDQDIKETTPEQSPAPLAPDSLDEVSDLDPALDVVSMTGASREEDSGGIGAQDTDIDLMDGPATGLDPDLSPTTPKHARIPKPESAPRSAHSVIDLTALSDGSEPLSPTPFLRPAMSKPSATPGSQISGPRYGGDPEQSTIAEIMTWTVDELQERSDKKRLVLKILRTNMSAKEYKQMRRHVTSVTIKALRDHLRQAMEAICCGGRPPGTEDKEWDILVGLARLYGCWSKVRFKYWQMKLEKYASILAKLLKTLDTAGSKRELDVFFTFVVRILKKFPSQKSDSVSVEPPSRQEENDEPIAADAPHKKRKRKVMQSASALSLRKSAQKRAEAQVEKERIFQERISSSQSNSDRLIVNPGEFGKDGAIYIHPSIGSRIKTHQVEGVKFMWRELVEAGHTDPQGCLLAHTMGLGKTMQTITLLVTIAEAAGSPDEHVRSQIPQDLRRMQVLILCPASLVNNWLDELHQWIPESTSKKIGVIREINAEIAIDKRLQRIHKWHRKGGILVMSYEMLRTLLSEKQPSKFSEEERVTIERRLLDGPSIIIADEAHRLKTSNSSLRHIVERFESKSRVALTGSPLANNLVEYWSMIDWISPGFLGSQKEFRAHFVEPIEEGLYKDSSPYEHRKALKKLRVLKSEIGPKINRADITVLKDDLKPKVEFLITVPLTDLQERLYKLCVQNLTAKRKDKVSNSRIWQWIHVLTMLCNHPAAFLKRLKNMQPQSEKPNQVAVEESESTDQPDLSMDDLGTLDPQADLSPDFIEQAISLFDVAQNPESPHHSFKTEILMGILETAREADDQVLVFSQHIPTLDYLENLLRKEKHRFIRLDGKTKMTHRPELLEKFNKGDFDVFLISTRAGGTGFNMPGANRVVIFDFGFNPQNEEQAIGRAYRIGQKKEVFVYRMLAGGTFEPKVWNKALFKTQLASRVVDTKNPERHAEKMRDYFFDPKPVEQQDLAEHQGKDKRVLDKILAKRDQGQDHGIRAITTTETLMTEDLDAALNEQEKEEVVKMIEAERLRKEDPRAWEQYLKDNPGIDDSNRGGPHGAIQRALFQESADRNGAPPLSIVPSSQPMLRPFIEFGAVPSGTAPTRTTAPGEVNTGFVQGPPQLDGILSSDGGINNAAPSPASMRRQLPLKHALRKANEPALRKDRESSPIEDPHLISRETREHAPRNASEPSAPIPNKRGRSISPELGDNPPSDAGVNNSGPSLPSMSAPASVSKVSSSFATRPNLPMQADPADSLSTDGFLSPSRSRRQTSPPYRGSQIKTPGHFMSSANYRGEQSSAGAKPDRSLTSPPNREVESSIDNHFNTFKSGTTDHS